MEQHNLYNGSVLLTFDPVKHVYTVGGKTVEGATGVTGVINKPALMFWAVNQAIECLQNALKPGVGYDELQLKSMLDEAKMAHRKRKTTAADIGTLAHEAIERFIKTGDRTPPVHSQAKACFESFLKWADDNNVEFLESERKIYSKIHGYAGTMDFVCKIGGKLYVGDAKTSTGIYDEMWFQVSAYQQAYEEEMGVKFDGQVITRIGKDGSFEVQYKNNDDYIENVKAFNGALALYKRMQVLKGESKYKD